MPKLKFNDLEYIVMEGGGARGAAYLGAIRALETLMVARTDIQKYNTNGRKAGLLDYYKIEGGKEIPVIKGIAGSSAGAITTFALALGFNSDEIETILNYEFTKFLEEKDAGKFRMIKEDGILAIGQDKKNKITGTKELAFDNEFTFRLDKNATTIGNNEVKRGFRHLAFSLVFKALIDGVASNAKQLSD